jgi:hypothetical protein
LALANFFQVGAAKLEAVNLSVEGVVLRVFAFRRIGIDQRVDDALDGVTAAVGQLPFLALEMRNEEG